MCDECGLSFCVGCDGTNGLAQGECMKCRMGYNRFDMREVIEQADAEIENEYRVMERMLW